VHPLHTNARGVPVKGLMISFTDAKNSAEALHRFVRCREAKTQTTRTLKMACHRPLSFLSAHAAIFPIASMRFEEKCNVEHNTISQ